MDYDPRTATYVTLVQNPDSGIGGPDRDHLVRLLGDEGFAVTYASTRWKGWEHVLDDPGAFVLVAGGDGTVGHVAERLVGRGVPIAMLSLGTANNIAKSLGLTASPEETVAGLRQATPGSSTPGRSGGAGAPATFWRASVWDFSPGPCAWWTSGPRPVGSSRRRGRRR